MNDIWNNIASHISDGITWKSFIFSCKLFYGFNTQSQIDRFSNHLLTLLKLFPDEEWNWYGISQNPNITWGIVFNNANKPWKWGGISRNPNITWSIITNNANKPWNWDGISMNTFGKK